MYVTLAEQVLHQFPQQAALLERPLAQHKLDPTRHLHGLMELASLCDAASLERALVLASEYKHLLAGAFVHGLLGMGRPFSTWPRAPARIAAATALRPRSSYLPVKESPIS
jgi:hypothetical protein